ncbi:hypothetical protein C8Q74DRAFT_1295276 [Fomes fomentarius]|nr:hypothetical protein C8Q74DRAFT_1295276 [Fomes fomentarius]
MHLCQLSAHFPSSFREMDESEEELAEDLRLSMVIVTLYLASAAVLCYDYTLTLKHEVEYMWTAKLSGSSILFYAVRYPVLFTSILVVVCQGDWVAEYGLSNMLRQKISCKVLLGLSMAFNLLVLISSAIFAAMRAYALCERSLSVLFIVMLFSLANPIIMLVTYTSFVPGLYPYPQESCGFNISMTTDAFESWTIAARIASIISDTFILAITWKKMRSWRLLHMDGIPAILLRNGDVLLMVNIVGLGLSRTFDLIEPTSALITM